MRLRDQPSYASHLLSQTLKMHHRQLIQSYSSLLPIAALTWPRPQSAELVSTELHAVQRIRHGLLQAQNEVRDDKL